MENRTIKFHVYLPFNIEKLGSPIVIGDEELKVWETPIVKLSRPHKHDHPTYWTSEPIVLNIPSTTDLEALKIKYTYAIQISSSLFKKEKIFPEENTNRFLDNRKNQYDIWIDSIINSDLRKYKIDYNNISSNYFFIDIIYNNINNINDLKESVLEYKKLLNYHKEFKIKFSYYNYIIKKSHDKNSLKDQRLFLCLLLGDDILRSEKEEKNYYELPENFEGSSNILIEAFSLNYKKKILSDDNQIIISITKAFLYLIKHNISNSGLEWLTIFTIIKEIDPECPFLESIYFKNINYDKKYLENIKNHINIIDIEIKLKITKWLVRLCQDIESLFEVWNIFLIRNKQITQCFIDRVNEIISNNDINDLMNNFSKIPTKEFKHHISYTFCKRILFLLKNPNEEYQNSNIIVLRDLLNESNLNRKDFDQHALTMIEFIDDENKIVDDDFILRKLFKENYSYWKNDDLNALALQKFFDDGDLNWNDDDIIILLELLSQSYNLELLKIFPTILNNLLFRKGFFDKKTQIICNNWFNQFLKLLIDIKNTPSDENDHLIMIFQQLDYVYPLLNKWIDIWNDLSAIAINEAKTCSEFHYKKQHKKAKMEDNYEALRKEVSKLQNEMPKDIPKERLKEITRNLNYDIRLAEERRIEEERKRLNGYVIKNPNRILETVKLIKIKEQEVKRLFIEIVREILEESIKQTNVDRLIEKIFIICDCKIETVERLVVPNTMCEDVLCDIMFLLQNQLSTLNPNPSEHHLSILKTSKFWNIILNATGSVEKLNENSYFQYIQTSIVELNRLLLERTINLQLLQQILEYPEEILLNHFSTLMTKDNNLTLKLQSNDYTNRLDHLIQFYTEFCPTPKVVDVINYIDDIQQRMQNSDKIILKKILESDYWEFHEDTLKSAEYCQKFIKSQTFRNIFEIYFQNDNDATNVKYVAQILMPKIFSKYNSECKTFETWQNIDCSDALSFWKDVKDISAEFDSNEELGSYKDENFIQSLEYLLKFPYWIEKLELLEKIKKVFKLRDENDWISKSIDRLNDNFKLGKIIELSEDIEGFLNKIDQNCWNFIKDLLISEDFLNLLKIISDQDIKNLINNIDDEKLVIQEDTILSLIQIKPILLTLTNKETVTTVLDFFKELSTVMNPILAYKIASCNSNLVTIKNMHYNLLNHDKITMEKITNIVFNGTFIFVCDKENDNCSVTLQYPSLTEDIYNLNDILNLREKALLMEKSEVTNDFIELIDIIQKIIDVATKLTQKGHVNYRKFEEKISGMDKMKEFLTILNGNLENWVNTINQVQELNYYLTFFTASNISEFYDYFTSKKLDKENETTCKALIKYVNRNAQLPSSHKRVSRDSRDYLGIGKRLENIFIIIPKQFRKFEMIKKPVISTTKDKLFVATYNDKLLIPNIIMSLYANNGYYPEPWQLLICNSSTTMDDLFIFIKRCFLAAKNGYSDILFCIINLELLDFELQYTLVNYIKEAQLKNQENYLLALLCHRELGTYQYILDHYSLQVQEISGLNNEMMQEIYQELCPYVLCVSSDLSGQGKTEWIKEDSFSKNKISHNFLISDGMSFEYLVKKLKECELKNIETLHINILSVDNPESVNLFLFELLTFNIVSYKDMIVFIPEKTFIYIEISSLVKQKLFNYIPLLKFLPLKNLSWNIENFRISQEITSPIQIVSHYLNLYDHKEVDTKELFFNNESNLNIKNPLSEDICRNLIMKYFFKGDNSSYRYIEIFINVLADQLIRLSSSQYFTLNNLKSNFKELVNIRSIIVGSLIEVSRNFATKLKVEQDEDKNVDTIAQWNNLDCNMIFFNPRKLNSFTTLHQNKYEIPDDIKLFVKCQTTIDNYYNNTILTELEVTHTMSKILTELKEGTYQHSSASKLKDTKLELITKLEKDIEDTKQESLISSYGCLSHVIADQMKKGSLSKYILSSDNLLKMALIILRVCANVPVVICGEAGCGKTSLITHLALMVEVQYQSLKLHAEIDEETITKFMSEALKKSEKGEIWILFDEINTCNHLGLLANLISNRIFHGKLIHPNIRLLATCNPYRIRNKTQKVKKNEEKSNLVYQVKPLPDQILDYVWDYGILKPKDEYVYIKLMVKNELKNLAQPIFAELLFASQNFIRKVEEPYSVSLRDVKRAITLVKFFYNSLNNRPPYKEGHEHPSSENPTIVIRSYVLALSLCYYFRLCEQDLRKQYRYEMGQIFQNKTNGEKTFLRIIHEEQEDYINRMQVPHNIVKNEALLENILAMIVCILTKIPIFVVGETGSSKSLAIRLISSNLCGMESNDDYFKSLPKIHIVPYLCSPSSTSDGINKVFEKAKKYQETSTDQFPVINVVLINNVGFAESNSSNSLKVLHSLLEPSYPETESTVSFIGTSNWRLDITKTNRALLVQRPQFDLDDLVDISEYLLNPNVIKPSQISVIESITKAYLDYERHGQPSPNFHNIRDYYSLIKNLSSSKLTSGNIRMELARNFGGIENNTKLLEKYFGNIIDNNDDNESQSYKPIQLINSNLDPDSRHLMVIGKSETTISLLTDQLRKMDPLVIIGSQFPDDREDYYYNVLNKIMTFVETGRPLILTDLENIYANLCDLWDQNYIMVGDKFLSRVALGAYSNPTFYVPPSFKCIIIMDEKNLHSTDQSILSRFEKQKLFISDMLNERQQSLVQQLKDWIGQMCTFSDNPMIQLHNSHTLFVGFDRDESLQSLVLDIAKDDSYVNDDEILRKCKESLIAVAILDGIVTVERSALSLDEIITLKKSYSQKQHHDNLYEYINSLFENQQNSNSERNLVIINTFSSINTNIKTCLHDFAFQVYKLSTFRTESQLSDVVNDFFFKSADKILFIQCESTSTKIRLTKYIIEQFQTKFSKKGCSKTIKLVCIIHHIQRGCEQDLILSNFISGWKQITIESLEQQNVLLHTLLNKSLYNILNSEIFGKIVGSSKPFEKILEDELQWCFSCIKYQMSNENYNNYISELSKEILQNENFIQCIKAKTFAWISENCQDWQFEVAKNRDYLNQFTFFSLALQNYVRTIVKQTIAKILYSIEKFSVTKTYFIIEKTELFDLWKKCFMDIDINNLPEPKPSRYIISSMVNGLEFPFSYYFVKQIDFYKIYYEEELDILRQDLKNIDDKTKELRAEVIEDHNKCFKNNILSAKPNFRMLQKYSQLYYDDFIKLVSYNKNLNSKKELDLIVRNLTADEIVNDPFSLHIHWWRHADRILIQLKLIENFPTILITAQESFIPHGALEQYLFVEAINFTLQIMSNNEKYEKDVDIILSLINKIDYAKLSKNVSLLLLCNDLLRIKLIPLEKIKEKIEEMVYLGKDTEKPEYITVDIIKLVLDHSHRTDNDAIRSFIMRCLEIIPLESEVRRALYKNLFTRKPFKLINEIIEKIFITENQVNHEIFLTLIKDQREALQNSVRLSTINNCIYNNTKICCDIIQKIFNEKWKRPSPSTKPEFELEELVPYFKNSVEIFIRGSINLQHITAIAFLKEFIFKFWEYYSQNKHLAKSLVNEINDCLKTKHPSIRYLRSYFVLQKKFFSFQFIISKSTFPWIEDDADSNLPEIWRLTTRKARKVNFKDLCNFYKNDFTQNLDKHPFISVYINHYEKLKLIKYLYPIVRFVKILNSKLEYVLTRKSAQMMTFHEFIEKESVYNIKNGNYLKSLFEEFSLGWNVVINYIVQYQSKELPSDKLFMSLERPVIFGLIEQKDTGIYLCAILEFLIKLHNEFLDNVSAIPDLLCKSPTSESIKLTQAQDFNFINYEWNEKTILQHCQEERTKFIFDLKRIEMVLVKELIFNKVSFEKDDQLYLKSFSFKNELFHNSRVLFDVKKLLPQEVIPMDKIVIVTEMFQSNLSLNSDINSINLSELLSLLEAILSFIKELSISNSDILIIDFINQWKRLARLNALDYKIFKEFSLKHITELYELIEGKVADNIDSKFKIPLTQQMKESINDCIDYDQNEQLIPAKTFALALKRFIYRFLLIDSNIESNNLNSYFLDFTLCLWPNNENIEKLVKKLFPTCLLVSHAYSCYIFITDEIAKKEKQNTEEQNTEKQNTRSFTPTTKTNAKKFIYF